jgi:hypothetical protein
MTREPPMVMFNSYPVLNFCTRGYFVQEYITGFYASMCFFWIKCIKLRHIGEIGAVVAQ